MGWYRLEKLVELCFWKLGASAKQSKDVRLFVSHQLREKCTDLTRACYRETLIYVLPVVLPDSPSSRLPPLYHFPGRQEACGATRRAISPIPRRRDPCGPAWRTHRPSGNEWWDRAIRVQRPCAKWFLPGRSYSACNNPSQDCRDTRR